MNRHGELAATAEDRDVLASRGVNLEEIELDPVEGATGHHVAIWIDDELEIEFMVVSSADVARIVERLRDSVAPDAESVEAGSVVVASVEVSVVNGELRFGSETARADWVR